MRKVADSENIKSFIYEWNLRFPLDRWWRQKYKVAFNSPEHRESCFIDQLLEYEEDRFFESLLIEDLDEEGKKIKPYVQGKGNWLKPRENKVTEAEIDDLFDNYKL